MTAAIWFAFIPVMLIVYDEPEATRLTKLESTAEAVAPFGKLEDEIAKMPWIETALVISAVSVIAVPFLTRMWSFSEAAAIAASRVAYSLPQPTMRASPPVAKSRTSTFEMVSEMTLPAFDGGPTRQAVAALVELPDAPISYASSKAVAFLDARTGATI